MRTRAEVVRRFRERLIPGPGTVVAVLLLLPAIWIILLPVSAGVAPIGAVVITLGVEVLLFILSPVVAVSEGVLSAGLARISVSLTGNTTFYRRSDAFQARGSGLDARAFTLFRGWVDPVVRIELTDPEDPAPYWLISTRRPEQLLEALAAERETAINERGDSPSSRI